MTYLTQATETQQARWQQVFSSLPETHFLFVLDREGHYLDLRCPDPKRLWTPPDDHIGKRFDDVLPPELATDRRYFFDKAIATHKEQQYSYPHPLTPGRHMTCIITPLTDADGNPAEVLMQVFDTAIAEVPPANVLPVSDSELSV
jgi:hypothetical protein